jgi:hypothetical protein
LPGRRKLTSELPIIPHPVRPFASQLRVKPVSTKPLQKLLSILFQRVAEHPVPVATVAHRMASGANGQAFIELLVDVEIPAGAKVRT